jgi:hypothetical protein
VWHPMPRCWVLVALCGLAAGCGGGEVRVSSELLDPAHPLPPKPVGARVRLLATVAPACVSDTIGYVTVEGGGPLPSRELTNALARAARRMGGDAIVGLQSGARAAALADTARPGEAASTGKLSGTVVRFRNPSCVR